MNTPDDAREALLADLDAIEAWSFKFFYSHTVKSALDRVRAALPVSAPPAAVAPPPADEAGEDECVRIFNDSAAMPGNEPAFRAALSRYAEQVSERSQADYWRRLCNAGFIPARLPKLVTGECRPRPWSEIAQEAREGGRTRG